MHVRKDSATRTQSTMKHICMYSKRTCTVEAYSGSSSMDTAMYFPPFASRAPYSFHKVLNIFIFIPSPFNFRSIVDQQLHTFVSKKISFENRDEWDVVLIPSHFGWNNGISESQKIYCLNHHSSRKHGIKGTECLAVYRQFPSFSTRNCIHLSHLDSQHRIEIIIIFFFHPIRNNKYGERKIWRDIKIGRMHFVQ